jgi:MATE family multidrug resistance protein
MTYNNYLFYIKRTITVALPIVLTEAGTQLTHVADSIMVGNVGSVYLAACSLANYIYLVPLLFGMGSTMAITPLVGNAFGSNNIDECKTLFSNAFFLQLINATLLTLIIFALGYLLQFIDSDVEKISLAHSYYNYLAFSTFPSILLFSLKSYLDGFGLTIYGMIAILLGNGINIFFNWVLIYGNLGFPALLLEGAGIATLISRVFSFGFIILILFTSKKIRKLVEFPKLSKVTKKKFKQFFNVGMNIGIQSSVEIAAFSLIVIFAGWLGTISAAAYQITVSISGLVYLSAMGISAAATVVISNFNGANEKKKVVECSRAIILLSVSFSLFATIILVATCNIIPNFFVNEAEVIAISSTLLFMIALFQVPDALNVTFAGILRGLLDTKMPMIINSLSFWLFMIPLSYFLAFILDLGIVGIMIGEVAGILFCAIAIYIRFRFFIKRYKL